MSSSLFLLSSVLFLLSSSVSLRTNPHRHPVHPALKSVERGLGLQISALPSVGLIKIDTTPLVPLDAPDAAATPDTPQKAADVAGGPPHAGGPPVPNGVRAAADVHGGSHAAPATPAGHSAHAARPSPLVEERKRLGLPAATAATAAAALITKEMSTVTNSDDGMTTFGTIGHDDGFAEDASGAGKRPGFCRYATKAHENTYWISHKVLPGDTIYEIVNYYYMMDDFMVRRAWYRAGRALILVARPRLVRTRRPAARRTLFTIHCTLYVLYSSPMYKTKGFYERPPLHEHHTKLFKRPMKPHPILTMLPLVTPSSYPALLLLLLLLLPGQESRRIQRRVCSGARKSSGKESPPREGDEHGDDQRRQLPGHPYPPAGVPCGMGRAARPRRTAQDAERMLQGMLQA